MSRRMLLLFVRRAPAAWIVVPAVMLNIAMIYLRDDSWVGIWPRASNVAQIPSYYIGPFFAACAAWTSGRAARMKMNEGEYPAARSAPSQGAIEIAPSLGGALLVYGAGFLAVSVSNVMVEGGARGHIWFGYFFVGLALIVMCIAIGHIVGLWLNRKAWLGSFVALCLTVVFNATAASRLALTPSSGDAWLELDPIQVSARCVVGMSVCVAAICWPRGAVSFGVAQISKAGSARMAIAGSSPLSVG